MLFKPLQPGHRFHQIPFELLHPRLGSHVVLSQGEDSLVHVVDGLGGRLKALVDTIETLCDSSFEAADVFARFCAPVLDILANSLHGSQELLHGIR